MSTNEGKSVLVELGALISWCIYSYRTVMLLVPNNDDDIDEFNSSPCVYGWWFLFFTFFGSL